MYKSTTILTAVLWGILMSSPAQSLEHPVIWTTSADWAHTLELIENYEWAERIVTKTKAIIDDKVTMHINQPLAILNTIPMLASDDNLSESDASSGNSKHAKVLNYAAYAGMLYHISKEEKYAQFAADILWYYIEELAPRSPQNTAMSGSDFYDPRSGYVQFAIAYDFIVNFLKTPGTKVYQKASGNSIDFDNVKAQKAVHNIAMNALHEHGGEDKKYGKMVSNHPILRAPGVLFSILCVEDDTERARMFNVFWNVGTKQQNSFTKTILPMFGEQGIWPEAVSYSFMQNVTLILNIVDRLKPEMNVMDKNMHILDGNFLFDNLRMPNRRFVRYGDSHRDIDKTGELYRYTLNLAQRRGYTDYVQKAKVALRQGYDAEGAYDPIVPMSTFGNYRGFEQLFWGINVPKSVSGEIDFQKPTVIIKHAGVALQRNYVEENNEEYGLCGIIGGAHYVHSHCTGITMELYGAGYVMAAGGGLPNTLAERKDPVHTGYFWRHAGNNTMIVNGTSHGIQNGAWNSASDLWMNTTVNLAAEPQHLEDPIHPDFSFATQFLDDKVNNDQQQRTLSTIRTSETSGYYFDLFRSKSLGENNFHDYIYHNLGDKTHIFGQAGEELSTTPTTRYQTDIGDTHRSPGWHFFEETQTTAAVSEAIHVRFDLTASHTYMNMFVPGGEEREYTKALGPGTREAKDGYEDKKTQIIAVRQQGEAWNKPYVHIFEPSTSPHASVKSVEHLYRGEVIVGAKVSSRIGGKVLTDYVICQEDASKTLILTEADITFTGRFAIVRREQTLDKAYLTLYIGEGSSLSCGEYSLTADASKKGQKVIETLADMSRVISFKDLENNREIEKGADLTVEAVIGTDFTEVSLFVNGVNAGTLTQEPYVWSSVPALEDMRELSYLVKIVAKDASGNEDTCSVVIKTPQQWAHTSDEKPHTLPGKIEFEDYDNGGLNTAYYDRAAQNTSKYTYRDDELVDLNSSGSIVVYIQGGEWLEYTIDFPETAYYKLSVRHQTGRTPAFEAFSVLLPEEGNKVLASQHKNTATGSGSYAIDVVGDLLLEKGVHVLRFDLLSYGYNLDYFELEKSADAFKVIYNDGTSTQECYTNANGTYQFPPTPLLPDSVFDGWFTSNGVAVDENAKPNQNMELFAAWKEKSANLPSLTTFALNVYPNPCQGQFTIDLGKEQSATYALYTLSGSEMLKGQFKEEVEVNVEHCNSGLYLLDVTTKDERTIQKIVFE